MKLTAHREIFEKHWKNLMLPLSFVFANLLNFGFYYLGMGFQENVGREYGFMLGCILFAVLTGITFLAILRKAKFSRMSWIVLGIVVLFYTCVFLAGILRYGLNKHAIRYLREFIVYCIPAFFSGICAAAWKAEKTFFQTMEKISFFVLPGAVIYFNGIMFNCNPFGYGRNFGIMAYMYFAYTIMPFFLVHLICFINKCPMKKPGREESVKRPQLLRGIMILIYWVAIYASGTRGTVVCVIVFSLLLVISQLVYRENVKRTLVLILAILMLYLFNLTVYAPAGMRWINRMDIFTDGLKAGQLVTTTGEDSSVSEQIDDLVAADSEQQVANRPEDQENPGTEESPTDIAEKNLQIGNRGTYYKIAFKEFLKAPITGMGFAGFSVKYGTYPHNAVLELMAETGLVGIVVLLGAILFVFVKLLIIGHKNKAVRYLLLFIIAYAVRANISMSVWECSALLAALGYGLAYSWNPKKVQTATELDQGTEML